MSDAVPMIAACMLRQADPADDPIGEEWLFDAITGCPLCPSPGAILPTVPGLHGPNLMVCSGRLHIQVLDLRADY